MHRLYDFHTFFKVVLFVLSLCYCVGRTKTDEQQGTAAEWSVGISCFSMITRKSWNSRYFAAVAFASAEKASVVGRLLLSFVEEL